MMHKCKESARRLCYYDGSDCGEVEIRIERDGKWYAGSCDAGLQEIRYCPFCGADLSAERETSNQDAT